MLSEAKRMRCGSHRERYLSIPSRRLTIYYLLIQYALRLFIFYERKRSTPPQSPAVTTPPQGETIEPSPLEGKVLSEAKRMRCSSHRERYLSIPSRRLTDLLLINLVPLAAIYILRAQALYTSSVTCGDSSSSRRSHRAFPLEGKMGNVSCSDEV